MCWLVWRCEGQEKGGGGEAALFPPTARGSFHLRVKIATSYDRDWKQWLLFYHVY
jgi:hypothetical protein